MSTGPVPAPFPSPYTPPGTPADVRKQIHFRTDGVDPPPNLYLDVNDFLLLQVFTIVPASIFVLRYRLLIPNGEIIQGEHRFLPTAFDRSANSFSVQMTEGFLLSFEVALLNGPFPRGASRVRVILLRGALTPGSFVTTALTQGYIDDLTDLSWPPGIHEAAASGQGNVRTITGTTPGAGGEISETVPTTARWKLKSFRFQLTTSAAVATRGVTLTIDDGANILFQIEAPSTQAASLVQQYNFGNIGARADKVYGTNVAIPLPMEMILAQGWRIRTVTTALQVGDQYTAPQYSVEEFITR